MDLLNSIDPNPPAHRLPVPQPLTTVLIADRQSPDRGRLESFVQRGYSDAFGANLRSHYPLIVGLMDSEGDIVAAAGVRFAAAEPLFLERYLDRPIEAALRTMHGDTVQRGDIVEIGSFAANGPARALEFFEALAGLLSPTEGRCFGVATVTPRLSAMLRRSGFDLTQIAKADPARVENAAGDWGSYYEGGPSVLAGEIKIPDPLSPPRRRRSRALRDAARDQDR